MATKAELIERVANEVKESLGLTKKATTEVANKIFDLIIETILKGEDVLLHGLGKFVSKNKTHISYPGIKPGVPRDPSTGIKKVKRHVIFKPARDLKLALNTPPAVTTDTETSAPVVASTP